MEIQEKNTQTLYISIHALQAKNNLEKMIDEVFRPLDSCIIDMSEVHNLELVYFKVVEKYKAKKGTASSSYKFIRATQSNWYIEIGNTITINLRRIKGTVINNN